MSLSKLQASFRAKLNTSSHEDNHREEKDYVNEIRALKQNFEDLRAPQLYQKMSNNLKTNPKNKKNVEVFEEKSSQPPRFATFGSNETKNILRESNKNLKCLDDEPFDENMKPKKKVDKENLHDILNTNDIAKVKADSNTQTTPRNTISQEDFSRVQNELNAQNK
jgi:hypothetical protein